MKNMGLRFMQQGARRVTVGGIPGDLFTAMIGLAAPALLALATASGAVAQTTPTAITETILSGGTLTSVRDYVDVFGAAPFPVKEFGIVYGLPGTGDSAKGHVAQMLKNMIANQQLGQTIGDINSKSIALVAVETEIPPFQAEGTRINVRVAALGDSKSIAGGTLFLTPLRSSGAGASTGPVYALAQGPIVGGGAGAATSGTISNGAIVVRSPRADFVQEVPWKITRDIVRSGTKFQLQEPINAKVIRLSLKRPDAEMATEIALKLNRHFRTFLAGREGRAGLPEGYLETNPIAYVSDPGTVDVRVPGDREYEINGSTDIFNFDAEPTKFLTQIYGVQVLSTWNDPAKIIINDKTKTFAMTGNVIVKRGTVSTGKATFTFPDAMNLGTYLEARIKNNEITTDQAILLIREMERAGMLKAEVISQ